MILVKDYESLEDTLLYLKDQVKFSLPFARKALPAFDNPEDLFYWLKDRVTYKADPKGIELLQCFPTLVSGERTGIPWAGDCDCFTITALTGLWVNELLPCSVILAGRDDISPVHIYAGVTDEDIPFDLTNEDFGYERDEYKFKQVLPFSIE